MSESGADKTGLCWMYIPVSSTAGAGSKVDRGWMEPRGHCRAAKNSDFVRIIDIFF